MSNISSGEGSFFRDLLGEGADAVVVSMDSFVGRALGNGPRSWKSISPCTQQRGVLRSNDRSGT